MGLRERAYPVACGVGTLSSMPLKRYVFSLISTNSKRKARFEGIWESATLFSNVGQQSLNGALNGIQVKPRVVHVGRVASQEKSEVRRVRAPDGPRDTLEHRSV